MRTITAIISALVTAALLAGCSLDSEPPKTASSTPARAPQPAAAVGLGGYAAPAAPTSDMQNLQNNAKKDQQTIEEAQKAVGVMNLHR